MDLRPLACWDCGFESCRGQGCLSLVIVVFCKVEVSASGWSLVQRSPTECDVSECDEFSIMRRPWHTRAVAPWQKKKYFLQQWCWLECLKQLINWFCLYSLLLELSFILSSASLRILFVADLHNADLQTYKSTHEWHFLIRITCGVRRIMISYFWVI